MKSKGQPALDPTEAARSAENQREWPPCTGPDWGPFDANLPRISLPHAAAHEVAEEDALVNVRAQLGAVTAYDTSAKGNQYWWPNMNGSARSRVLLQLTEPGAAQTLEVLADASDWDARDAGRSFDFALHFCEGNTGRTVLELKGYEPLGRVAGGDPAQCEKPERNTWPWRAIEALRFNDVRAGGFRTTGWVSECFEPTPCPEHVICKPTPGSHLLLASSLDFGSPIIQIQEACGKRWQKGKQYEVALVLHDSGSLGYSVTTCPPPH